MITNVRTKGLDKNLPDTLKFPYQRIKHKKIRRQEVLYLMLNITNLLSLLYKGEFSLYQSVFINSIYYKSYICLYNISAILLRREQNEHEDKQKKVSKLSKACISKIRYFKCTFLSI